MATTSLCGVSYFLMLLDNVWAQFYNETQVSISLIDIKEALLVAYRDSTQDPSRRRFEAYARRVFETSEPAGRSITSPRLEAILRRAEKFSEYLYD